MNVSDVVGIQGETLLPQISNPATTHSKTGAPRIHQSSKRSRVSVTFLVSGQRLLATVANVAKETVTANAVFPE